MTPYYQDDVAGITIYHGDCRDVLPGLGVYDLLLTDPPYGIAEVWQGGKGHGWAKASEESGLRNKWDGQPPDAELIRNCISHARHAVIWGANHFELPPSRGWFVWNKPERNFTLAEAELAWTNRDTVIRVYDANRSDPGRLHPTQKPLTLMRWCIEKFPDVETVLDPFMGSGTTLRAAADAGKRAVGIEIEEKYCEIAVQRLAQGVLEFHDWFESKQREHA